MAAMTPQLATNAIDHIDDIPGLYISEYETHPFINL